MVQSLAVPDTDIARISQERNIGKKKKVIDDNLYNKKLENNTYHEF